MIKLIIFDFDGVIVTGTNEGYYACYHKALEAVGSDLSPEQESKRIKEGWSKGYKKQFEILLREHPEKIDEAIREYEKWYHSDFFTDRIKLIEGAYECLKKLSESYTLAIASGMIRVTMDQLLKKYAINMFASIITNDDITRDEDLKPAPYMIKKTMEVFGASPDETIYVGDAHNDITMARNAGVEPIVVLTGNLTREAAQQMNVKYIIDDVTKLDEVLIANDLLQ